MARVSESQCLASPGRVAEPGVFICLSGILVYNLRRRYPYVVEMSLFTVCKISEKFIANPKNS